MAVRSRFSRIRKRTFVVTALTTAAVLLTAGFLSLLVVSQAGSDDLVTISVSEGQSRSDVLGSGISLAAAESSNLLQDPSFEPLVFRQALTVYSGDTSTLTVSSEEASSGKFGDGFFDGAEARVLTRTDDGLFLKKAARVLHYGINRVGIFSAINLPDDAPSGLAVLAFTRSGDVTVAVGEKGLIIYNAGSQAPTVAESGISADLTGVCATDSGYIACSDEGELLESEDGLNWQITSSYSGCVLRAVAADNAGLFAAVGDKGCMIVGKSGSSSLLQPLTESDLNDIVSSGSSFAAVGDEGVILTSQSGILWRSAGQPENTETDWLAADYRGSRFVAVGSGGAVSVSDDGTVFTRLDHQTDADYVDIVMLTRRQLIVLDSTGGFAVSNDSGTSWLSSTIQTGMQSQVIALAGKDKILSADGEGTLGLAQLVAEIQLDSPLKEGQFQAGDLIFLEKAALTLPASYLTADSTALSYQDPWQHYGAGISLRTDEDASPAGGTASMLLQSDMDREDSASIVSQVIDTSLIRTGQNTICKIELWMKQVGVADRSALVWLTGPFGKIGTRFTNVGTTWKKYTYSFILPANAVSVSAEPLRLNISVSSGSLWIDQASLTQGEDDAERLSEDFTRLIESIGPQFIRLGFLCIGSPEASEESWALSPGNESSYIDGVGWAGRSVRSLSAALQMSAACSADPWLVIDSGTSQAELLNMIEYLAGPISEAYGKLRMDQGSVMPWTDRFNRIIFEYTDSSDTLSTDQLKADFVNLMIAAASQSPYYRQIKGQLIFVDGMAYEAGVVLSTADFHATDLNGIVQSDSAQGLADAFTAYYDLIPRNPEKQVQEWPELMRSASLRANGVKLPTLAELTTVLLSDLGDHSTLSNLALPSRSSQDWQQAWPSAAFIASSCARGVPLSITVSESDLRASGFASESQIALSVVNLSDTPATCSLLTDLSLQNALLYRYDAKGQLISKTRLKSTYTRLAVLGGGAILIVKDREG